MGRPGTDVVEATTTLEYSLGIGVGVGTPTAGGCKKVELDIAIAAVMVCLR